MERRDVVSGGLLGLTALIGATGAAAPPPAEGREQDIAHAVDKLRELLDWAVRHQQPLNVLRRDDGRYTMTFMFTTLVLRPDQADDHVSLGYDADSR